MFIKFLLTVTLIIDSEDKERKTPGMSIPNYSAAVAIVQNMEPVVTTVYGRCLLSMQFAHYTSWKIIQLILPLSHNKRLELIKIAGSAVYNGLHSWKDHLINFSTSELDTLVKKMQGQEGLHGSGTIWFTSLKIWHREYWSDWFTSIDTRDYRC